MKERFSNFIRFNLGSREDIQFWEDLWCGFIPLKDKFRYVFLIPNNKVGSMVENFDSRGEGSEMLP